jgi:hypothetical protein
VCVFFLNNHCAYCSVAQAKYYSKVVQGKYEYFHHAPGQSPPFVPMPTASNQQQGDKQQQNGSAQPIAGAQALAAATPAVPTAPSPAQAAVSAAAEVAAAKAAALAAAAAQEKEAKRQAKLAMAINVKKGHADIDKWKSRQQEGDDTPAAPPPASSAALGGKVAGVGAGLHTSNGSVGVAPLLALGTDYASIGKLRLLPEGSVGGEGLPLVEGSGDKWACLVSRRAFASEEQLAKHVRISKLYREELSKAIDQGRVVIARR